MTAPRKADHFAHSGPPTYLWLCRDDDRLGIKFHLALWRMAEASPLGIRITTDDRDLLRQQLYRARAEAGGFQDVVIIYPKQEGQLLLVHRDADERGGTDEGDSKGIQAGSRFPAARFRLRPA